MSGDVHQCGAVSWVVQPGHLDRMLLVYFLRKSPGKTLSEDALTNTTLTKENALTVDQFLDTSGILL